MAGSKENGASGTTRSRSAVDPVSTAAGAGSGSSLVHAVVLVGLLNVMYYICLEAYKIRLYAINEFGRIIHEFDPYFNYRATEYLYENGWEKFRTWFDYKVWYPLGRPVGTTIFPGMQVTAVLLKKYLLPDMSINDICVFIPAWFGVTATLAVAWLTYECTRGPRFRCVLTDLVPLAPLQKYVLAPLGHGATRLVEQLTGTSLGMSSRPQSPLTPLFCAVFAAAIMSVVPAHLLRSIGGGYDNESVAMTAMALTFSSWTLSMREDVSLLQTTLCGIITGLAYFYMTAAWGGYVFVLNLIAVHAGFLVLIGRYSSKLHRAYTAFYLVGTFLAMQVPVVGWTPLKSLEQLSALAAFGGLQLLEICRVLRAKRKLKGQKAMQLYFVVFGGAGLVALALVFLVAPTGYFGPISSRVRGLFVKHTKTGNPLVDSVAEHQAASPGAYFQYLHDVCYLAPVGLAFTCLAYWNDSSSFLLVYSAAAYYFSHRMVRLILLTAPIASVLGGICLGRIFAWMMSGVMELVNFDSDNDSEASKKVSIDTSERSEASNQSAAGLKKGKAKNGKKTNGTATKGDSPAGPKTKAYQAVKVILVLTKVLGSFYAVKLVVPNFQTFHKMSHMVAQQISHPTIIQKARTRDGANVMIDDYREAYFWLRDNTPEDARIMAWWDYGYQITGIANRTTIADGNTWNHEHIALLGRTLTGPEKDAHRIARHLADYILVWAGGGGDDVAKSPHLRRIANSVYRGLCSEPTCREFGFYADRTPSAAMKESMLYKLHSHGIVPGVEADRNRFREVFSSKYGKVRIYKILSVDLDSKKWVEENRVCDAPGSWFCRGQYPPALEAVLKEKKDFKQLEDFNAKGGDDQDYQKEYFENLKRKPGEAAAAPEPGKRPKLSKLSPDEIDILNEDWTNTETTSLLYEMIAGDKYAMLLTALQDNPRIAHVRSEDGRGPMFWAHEHDRRSMIKILRALGVSETRTDANGRTPLDKK